MADLASQAVGGGLTRASVGRTISDALSRRALPIALAGSLSVVPNVSTTVSEGDLSHVNIYVSDSATFNERAARIHYISELGWTTAQAATMRHKLAAWAEDWNDPAMDVYDAL